MGTFDDLRPSEQLVLDHVEAGAAADLSGGAETIDVSKGNEWGDDRALRSEFLAALCTGEIGKVGRHGLIIRGARIDGRVDLAFADIPFPVECYECFFASDNPLELNHLRIRALALAGCHVSGINGDELTSDGTLYLGGGFTSNGEVRLLRARVGDLYCDNGKILHPNDDALSADGIAIDGSAVFGRGFVARGTVRMPRANIGVELIFDECILEDNKAVAVVAHGIQVDGNVVIRNTTSRGMFDLERMATGGNFTCRASSFENEGGLALDISSATVAGMCDLQSVSVEGAIALSDANLGGARFSDTQVRNVSDAAVMADRLTVRGSVLFEDDFSSYGEVRLGGARVQGQLQSHGTFSNPEGSALFGDGLSVEGDLLLRDGFTADGQVRLVGAKAATLDLDGAQLSNGGDIALIADRFTTAGSAFLGGGFKAEGRVMLRGATIGGQLACGGGSFLNPGDRALGADGIQVAGGTFLSKGFRAEGEVRFIHATLGASFTCRGGTISHSVGPALDCEGMVATGDVLLDDDFSVDGSLDLSSASIGGSVALGGAVEGEIVIDARAMTVEKMFRLRLPDGIKGVIDLTGARVGKLDDDGIWPDEVRLDGFIYESLTPLGPVDDRLEWVRRYCSGKAYVPQPYEQLATMYRSAGHEAEARTVAVAREHARRATLKRRVQPLHWLFGLVVGYGYRLWRPLLPLLLAVLMGSFLFADAHARCGGTYRHAQCAMTPTREVHNLPDFQPAVYALDTVLPIIDLRQQAFWTPQDEYRWWFWVLIASGWIFTTAIVGGFSRAVTRG